MSKKRYKIRVDRIIAVLILISSPIFLLIVLSKHSKEEKPNSSSSEVQTETSAVCTSSTKTATTTPITTEPVTIPIINAPLCSASAFYSVDDNSYIYKDNIMKRVAPASLTKLLTASVALHYVDKDRIFTVDSEQWLVQPNSSLCYLQIGNTLTLEDLITGTTNFLPTLSAVGIYQVSTKICLMLEIFGFALIRQFYDFYQKKRRRFGH